MEIVPHRFKLEERLVCEVRDKAACQLLGKKSYEVMFSLHVGLNLCIRE